MEKATMHGGARKDMKPNGRKILVLAGIVTLALTSRLAWSYWADPVPGFLSDPEYYNATALSIARGQGYSVMFDGDRGFLPGGDPTAFWPPGFALVLGAAYWVFGESINVARTVNVVAGALTVIPIYFIGRRLFGEGVGMTGAVIAALLPSLVFWTPLLFSETMFTLLFASAMAMMLHSSNVDRGLSPLPLALAGVLTGCAALFRGQALLLLPLTLIWVLLSGGRLRPAVTTVALMAAMAAMVIAPWTVRNFVQMESPIAVSANVGYNLRIGHAPYSTGRYLVPQDLWSAQPGLTFQEREVLFNTLGRERAIEYALAHPKDELTLAGRKIVSLWRPDSNVLDWVTNFGRRPLPDGAWEPLRLLLDSSYLTMIGVAAGGLLFGGVERRSQLFVLSLVALWTLMHIVFFGEPRFHIPVLAVIVPASAVLPVKLAGGIRAWYSAPRPGRI